MAGCFSDRMIFIPPPSSYTDSDQVIKIPVGEHESKSDNENISAFHLPNGKAEYTILYSHGNAEDIGHNDYLLARFRDHGYSVFAYDYRGYGTSEGKPSTKHAYEDADAAFKYLTGELGTDPGKVIVYGRSVGAGLATYLAEKHDVGALVIQSGFVTAFRVITHYPILPFDKFKNIDRIKNINCPVFITHGQKDKIVKPWHGKKLYEAANDPKLKLWVPNTGHNEDLIHIAGERFWDKMDELEKAINQNQSD
ncbi:Esterase/lipase [Anaerohalosphaera lusitana]|uniref:Esterase/lipase n=1 Tax=Anaerohalosphaera lusitana TaxID=1936003 RepID=A0A1U9NK52_9BACT|nr:alpha/beta hydrolase [Anaerohalosphaera lusitana]AQT68114.1 Esterase/lipase [Anaerohalosphaera lusitana]